MTDFDGRKLIREAEKRGAEIRSGRGDHVIVKGPRGMTVIPNRQMGKGLFRKIVKQLALIGLALLFAYIWFGPK
jgi:predicted RNA binding protein YcfA (HicA-like mRNA interferase family)